MAEKDNIKERLDKLEKQVAYLLALAHPPTDPDEAFEEVCEQFECMDLEYKKQILS